MRRQIQVHGHRGARARRPENTIPSFEYAIEEGVDAIEMDLQVTRDNVIVISHDPVLEPPLCTGPVARAVIRDVTLAELRQWDCAGERIPALDDVFHMAGRGNFAYNLEIKSYPDKPEYSPPPEEFARMLLTQIRKYQLETRVLLQSFDFRTLIAMRKLAPEIHQSALTESDSRNFQSIAAEAGHAESVSPEFHLVTPAKVEAAHRAGLQVISWTANTPADWDRLIRANVDAIITDDPAQLIAYLKSQCLR